MATRQLRQIVETPTEARQAEPGPLGACPARRLNRARDADPRRRLVRVVPHLTQW